MCAAQSSSAQTKIFGASISSPPGRDQEVSGRKDDSEHPGGEKHCGLLRRVQIDYDIFKKQKHLLVSASLLDLLLFSTNFSAILNCIPYTCWLDKISNLTSHVNLVSETFQWACK